MGAQHRFERGIEPDQVLWPSDTRRPRSGTSVDRAALRANDDHAVTSLNVMAA